MQALPKLAMGKRNDLSLIKFVCEYPLHESGCKLIITKIKEEFSNVCKKYCNFADNVLYTDPNCSES